MYTDLLMFLLFMSPALFSFMGPIRLLMTSKPVIGPQWMMGVMQTLIGLAIVFYAADYYHILYHPFIGELLFKGCALFVYPVFYLYVCALTSPEGITRRNRIIGFLPSIAFLAILVPLVFRLGADNFLLYQENIIERNDYSMDKSTTYNLMVLVGLYGFQLFILFQVFFIMVFGFNRLRRYKQTLKDFNPVLVSKAQVSERIAICMAITVVLIYSIVLIKIPRSSAEMGLLYVLLMAFSVVQSELSNASLELDFCASDIEAQRRANELRNQKTTEK